MKSLLLVIFIIVSCNPSSDRTLKRRTPTTPTHSSPSTSPTPRDSQTSLATNFKTRLYPYLEISGSKCQGGERVRFESEFHECKKNEWLITVDNMNTCDNNGCTSIDVEPIIAKLERNDMTSNNTTTYYEITPASPAWARSRQILREVHLKANRAGKLEIIRKYY